MSFGSQPEGGFLMAVAFFSQWPKLGDQDSAAVAANIAEKINATLGGQPPDGAVYHAEGPSGDGGWWVFDVWTSDAACEAFTRDILAGALASVGIGANDGTVRRLAVQWDSSQMMGPPPA
jgi:hypothetical protein